MLYRISLKSRLWLSFVLLVAASVAATGALSFRISAGVMEKNASRLSQQNLDTSAKALDEQAKRLVVAVLNMTISEPFTELMKDVRKDNQYGYYINSTSMDTLFAQAKLTEPLIDSIYVGTPIGEFYSSSFYRNYGYSFYESPLFVGLQENRKPRWIEGHTDRLFRGEEHVVSLVMGLPDPEAPKVYFVLNVKEKNLRSLVTDSLSNRGNPEVLLINRKGDSVFSLQESQPVSMDPEFLQANMGKEARGHFEGKLDGKPYLFDFARLQVAADWVLVSVQARSELLGELAWIKWATALITLLCIAMALILSNWLTGFLLKPLRHLQSLMKRAGGSDLSVRFASPYRDEVSHVGMKFNSMLEEIGVLIEEVKLAEKEKRRSEAKALQAQISPHFLYNTLNTIVWKLETREVEESKEMVVALSHLFQLGLNGGQELTTLDKELRHVGYYLTIQQKCYEELFDYEIRVEEERLLALPMVKILLQPLVENTLLHGFRNRESGGFIRIHIREADGQLEIAVEDNGSGMDAPRLQESLKEPAAGRKGYALRNVYHRLKLYFGDEASMELHSVPDERTAVILRIPMRAEGERTSELQA
ncbi:sensor histidine kinase [Gorillibacterium sp. sgz5001074]|uniref:sensor histidine kinase n=1 Tax=Gorillibacterium sp. sgz5001074 TaxID=3446695 RepID=UPI003F66A48E